MSEKLIRFDWAIKKLLRSKANFKILEGFLSELLSEDIVIVNILESEGNKESENDKFNRVDIMVEDDKKEIILIELQITKEFDFLSRLLYGTSKVITEYMKEGDKYKDVKKVYGVGIVYFELGQGEDYIYRGTTNFVGIHLKDELKLNESQKKVYCKEEVSEIYPEYFIIRVNQFNDVAKNSLDEWIYFLKNDEIKEGFNAKGLLEAKEKLNIMKLPDEDKVIYKRYLESLHLEASLIDSSYGLGKIEGKIEGKVEGKIEVVIKSLGILDDKAISQITGFSIEEVRKIREENS